MKDIKETTVGKLLDRIANGESVGSMEHTIETGTILKIGAVIMGVVVFSLILKKYVFK